MRHRLQVWTSTRRRSARGAVALMMSLTIGLVLLPLASFAVDIGMQRMARRDMQAVADVVALDMARNLSAGSAVTNTEAGLSAARTKGTVGSTPTVKVYLGKIAAGATFVSDQSLGCGGAGTAYNSYFTRATSADEQNAVLVTASTSVDFRLSPGSGGVCRSAIAGIPSSSTPTTCTTTPCTPTNLDRATACYTVGSFAAAVSTSNSALIDPLMRMLAQQSGAFSNSSEVMALSYQGLAVSKVDLLQLATNLGLGSINELATATVKLKDLYVATASALVQPANSTSVTALGTLVRNTTYSQATVALGRILGIGSGVQPGSTASINLLDLVGGSLAVVNGTNLASLNIASTLPGIMNANFQVKLIQGAHQFCGAVGDSGTTATDPSLTEQLGITSTAQLAPVNATISLPAIPGLMGSTSAVVALPNNVNTKLSVAPTQTTLTGVRCVGNPKGIDLQVKNGLATVTIDTYLSNIQVNADILNLKILGIPIASLNSKISVNTAVKVTATVSPSGTTTLTINVPSQAFDTYYASATGQAGLGPVELTSPSIQIQSNATLLGIISTGAQVNLDAGQKDQLLNAVVTAVVKPMFDSTNPTSFVSTVVNPMLGLLGTKIGGAYVSLNGTPPPTCEPRLMG